MKVKKWIIIIVLLIIVVAIFFFADVFKKPEKLSWVLNYSMNSIFWLI
jgi:hypothetical protein